VTLTKKDDPDWEELQHLMRGVVSVPEVAIAAATVGPFLTAYCTELGKRFGGSTADWISKIGIRRRRSQIRVPVKGAVTVFEIPNDMPDPEHMPDEAKLALIDLDLMAEGVRGQRLRWDAKAGQWVVADQGGAGHE
jgi:hypothetical protein